MSTLEINCTKNAHLINDEILERLHKGAIYWSDTRCTHWMFDFKVDDLWVENITLNNEFNEVTFIITKLQNTTDEQH